MSASRTCTFLCPGGDASLDVSDQLLVTTDSDDSFCSGYLHAEIELMDYCFEFVYEASTEDLKIGVVHFHHIEGYVLCSGVGGVPERYGQCDLAQGIHSFAFEAYERYI